MELKRTLIGLGLALTLGACATTPATHLTATRATTVAWASLDAAAVTLKGMAQTHRITGSAAASAADTLEKARAALRAADRAYNAGDQATAQQNAEAGAVFIAELTMIASKGEK